MNTFICPECEHESTYDPWVESAHCPKCGYTPHSPSAPDDSISSQSNAHTSNPAFTPLEHKDAKSFFKDFYKSFRQVHIDWRYVVAYAAIGLALGAMVIYGTQSYFKFFGLPSKAVLGMFVFTLLGIYMMIDGLRMALAQKGWVRLSKYAFRRSQVTGIMAFVYGLGRMFIGLVILMLGNPLIIVMFRAAIIYIVKFVR